MYKVATPRGYHQFEDWWDLISFLINSEDKIAHNENDIWSYYNCDKFSRVVLKDDIDLLIELLAGIEQDSFIRERTWDYREFTVFDEYDRVINLSEIREAIKKYVPREKARKKRIYHNVYRVDPVPYTGRTRWNGRRSIPMNRRYFVDAMSCLESSRLKNQLEDRLNGEWCYKSISRNWKKNRKNQYKERIND